MWRFFRFNVKLLKINYNTDAYPVAIKNSSYFSFAAESGMKMLFNRSVETLEYLSFCGNLRKLNHDVIIDKVQTLNAIEIR